MTSVSSCSPSCDRQRNELFARIFAPGSFLFSLSFLFLFLFCEGAVAQKVATTTSLALTSASGPATTVSYGVTAITLTATVTPVSGTITTGQVNFCVAAAAYCTDVHIVGTAQITSAGTASIKLRPMPGNYSYKAQFVGTNAFAASLSAASSLTVTGKYPSITSFSQTGGPGNYQLTATVSGSGKVALGPGGNVALVDTTANNQLVATVSLGNATTSVLGNIANPAIGTTSTSKVGDFDEDGNLDLVASYQNSSPTVDIFLGDGKGNFTPAPNNPISSLGTPAAVGDFNSDGHLDILIASQGTLSVLLGKGDGTFQNAPGSPISTVSGYQPLVVADFNGEGIPDFAAAGGYYLTVFLGNGDGSFKQVATTSSTISQAELFASMVTGDFNNDGIQDLAVTSGIDNSVTIFAGNGDGTFKAGTVAFAASSSGNPYGLLAVADLNGDGKLDLAVPFNGSGGSVAVLLGNGDGSFQQPSGTPFQLPYINRVFVGDFNGDNIPDLFAAAQTNQTTLLVLQGKGDGTFTSISTGNVQLPCCSNSSIGDFNQDGITDVVSTDAYSGRLQVLFGQVAQANAVASNVNPVGPGTDQIVAQYAGDTNYNASTSTALALQSQVAAPVLSPPPGVYTSVQTITITDSSPGSSIYYYLSTDSTSGAKPYTGPITLSNAGAQVFTVYATAPGSFTSAYVQAPYTLVLPQVPAPSISLVAGAYSTSQTVSLSDSLAGAQIYYTTDGSRPIVGSNLYSGPITISSSETLTAVAYAVGYSQSQFASAQYIIASSSVPLIYTLAGTGTYGYTGDGAAATLAEIDFPYAAVKDAAGNLYIADSQNWVVRKVAAGTGIITTYAGNNIPGYSGDGGPASSAQIQQPSALALDTSGNLFIADINGTVRMVDHATGIISTYAGNPTAPSYNSTPAQATSVALGGVTGIAIDASRNVYLSTFRSVLVVNDSTKTISTLAGANFSASSGGIGDNGPASAALLNYPRGLAFDTSGSLYIADSGNVRIRKITATNGVVTPNSIITTVAGTTGPSTNPEAGGPATSIYLYKPAGIAVDASNNLYIADMYTNLVWQVNASTQYMSRVAGHFNSCGGNNGDGGAAASAPLCEPYGISVDPSGNLILADTLSNRIREIVTAGPPPATQAATPVISPASGTYSAPQAVTITDSTPGAEIYVTFDGSAPTAVNYGYSFPITAAGTSSMKAFAVAPGYLSSAPASASYTVTAAEPVISTIAGNGIGVLFGSTGSVAAMGSGGPALNALITGPQALAIDKAGNVYFADVTNEVVWKLSATDGTATVVAGTGQSGYLNQGNGGIATKAPLNSPTGLAVDSLGNLYIADNGNYFVRKVSAATGIISVVAGSGVNASIAGNGDGGPAT